MPSDAEYSKGLSHRNKIASQDTVVGRFLNSHKGNRAGTVSVCKCVRSHSQNFYSAHARGKFSESRVTRRHSLTYHDQRESSSERYSSVCETTTTITTTLRDTVTVVPQIPLEALELFSRFAEYALGGDEQSAAHAGGRQPWRPRPQARVRRTATATPPPPTSA